MEEEDSSLTPGLSRVPSIEQVTLSILGKSLIFHARLLGNILGLKNLYLEFEGVNPTGTQKDRAALSHVLEAKENGYDTISVGTCGNYGVAVAYYANLMKMKSVIYVPAHYTNKRVSEMARMGASIVYVHGSYEETVEASIRDSKENNWYDANPGSKYADVALRGYATISYEIFNELGFVPDIVIVPVGNGSTLAGIYQGFVSLRSLGLIDRLPKIVGATTCNGNPLLEAFRKNLSTLVDLSPNEIKETAVSEPLVSYHAYDGEAALEAIRKTNGIVECSSDNAMVDYARLIRKYAGLDVLPASAVTVSIIKKLARYDPLISEKNVVAVLTGRRIL
ncbi:MAG: pyridoxal-phosphate dependent enzyme [Thermoprotei archaeon]